MIIAETNSVSKGGGTDVTRLEAIYWAECHRAEALRARRYPNRPDREVEANIAAYWRAIFTEDIAHDSRKSA